MKARDYLFLAVTVVCVLLAGQVEPRTPSAGVQTGIVARVTYWLALLRLARGTPPPTHAPFQRIQELPDAVVNAPPRRLIGEDGEPLLDHSAGW